MGGRRAVAGLVVRFDTSDVDGAVVVTPTPHVDDRGQFARTFCAREFADAGLTTVWVQSNAARTARRGTLRGMHLQLPPAAEAKLVTCTRGAVHDVVVDVRPGSPTHGRWFGIELTADEGLALHVPAGCAHGYLSLVDDVEVRYQVSEYYTPGAEVGFRFDDPAFGIEWPIAPTTVSDKDLAWAPWGEQDWQQEQQ